MLSLPSASHSFACPWAMQAGEDGTCVAAHLVVGETGRERMDLCSRSPRGDLPMDGAGSTQPKGTDPGRKPPQHRGLRLIFWPTRLLSHPS